MKRIGALMLMMFCTIAFWCDNGFTTVATPYINITKLIDQPPGWNPGVNANDIDIINLTTLQLPNPGIEPYRFHVSISGGILDLHISVPEGQLPLQRRLVDF